MTTTLDVVRGSVLIKRPIEEVYSFWRHLENLPLFMTHLKEVRDLGNCMYHWESKAPLAMTASWDAQITEEQLNKLLRWESVKGSEVENSGMVSFTDLYLRDGSEHSTLIEVELYYKPPLGKVGAVIASLFGENPKQQITEDLENLKRSLEREK